MKKNYEIKKHTALAMFLCFKTFGLNTVSAQLGISGNHSCYADVLTNNATGSTTTDDAFSFIQESIIVDVTANSGVTLNLLLQDWPNLQIDTSAYGAYFYTVPVL